MKEQPLRLSFINACTVKRHFYWCIPFTKSSFAPKTLFTHASIKTKAEGDKKSMLNDFQPCTVPSSTRMKLNEEKTPVSPFPIKASTSSQSLFKWKEKLCPLPYLNSHWKPPESILSKLIGLDGNSMPYCFGTNCQLMTQQTCWKILRKKCIYSKKKLL